MFPTSSLLLRSSWSLHYFSKLLLFLLHLFENILSFRPQIYFFEILLDLFFIVSKTVSFLLVRGMYLFLGLEIIFWALLEDRALLCYSKPRRHSKDPSSSLFQNMYLLKRTSPTGPRFNVRYCSFLANFVALMEDFICVLDNIRHKGPSTFLF